MAKETKTQIGLSIDYIFHPGETLKEILDDRDISQKELATRTGVSTKHVSTIINGQENISVSYAKKLEYALGIEASFFINLQNEYDREIYEFNEINNITKEELKVIDNLKDVIHDFHLNAWIDENKDKTRLVLDLRKFFRVSNLINIPKLSLAAAYRTSNKSIDKYVLYAWQRMCEEKIKDINLEKELNISKLKENISNIKALMKTEPNKMRQELKSIFAECGIIFEIVRNYKGAPVQGYIKNIDKNIMLCMTIRGKYADIFWFSLFHEIAHILNGDAQKNSYIDIYLDKNKNEYEADMVAENLLINKEKYDDFVSNNNDFSYKDICRFSKECEVEPWIVIGRLLNDDLIEWSKFEKYRNKYKWAANY